MLAVLLQPNCQTVLVGFVGTVGMPELGIELSGIVVAVVGGSAELGVVHEISVVC